MHRRLYDPNRELNAYHTMYRVFNSMDALLYVIDPDSCEILFSNKRAQEVFGPINGKICWQALQKGQSGPCSFCTNSTLMNQQGTKNGMLHWDYFNEKVGLWLDCSDQTIAWEDGRTVCLKLAVDITEHKRMENELSESRDLLGVMFDSIKDGISLVDTELTILKANHTIRQWCADCLPIEGKKCYQVYHKRSIPCESCPTVSALQSGKKETAEVTRMRGSEEQVLEFWSYPLVDPSSKAITGAVEIIRDVTEKRKAEGIIDYHHRFRNLISEISHSFMSLPLDRHEEAIQQALCSLGEFFRVERSLFLECSNDGLGKPSVHQWCATPSLQLVPLCSAWQEMRALGQVSVISIDEMPSEMSAQKVEWERCGINSLIVAPAKQGDVFVGLLALESTRSKEAWNEEELSLLTIVVDSLAAAVAKKEAARELADYSDKLDKEVYKAKLIQERTLLTTLPETSKVSFAAYYQPSRQMGGDFYAVIPKGDKLIVWLSDVSGHGLDAAMMSCFVRATLHSYVAMEAEEKLNPEGIARFLSHRFNQESYPEDYFIAFFVAVLDRSSMEMMYTAAGFQNTPLLALPSGVQTKLVSPGLPLSSTFPEKLLNLKNKSVILEPGATVLFFTDGLSEGRSGDEGYEERLTEYFYQNSFLPPNMLVDLIYSDFTTFGGDKIVDDVSFLVMQLNPEDQSTLHCELPSTFDSLAKIRTEMQRSLPKEREVTELFMAGVHELVANAIEHGNKADPSKIVSVQVSITERQFSACVVDQGQGFNWRAKLDSPLLLDGSSERGRGIAMTRMLSSQVIYNHKGNRASLRVERNRNNIEGCVEA